MSDAVSILIPAYAAESFIDQTLLFARGQTYSNVQIVVSVDQCADTTFERVRAHAQQDPRISAFEQSERLGWAGNVNFLLERVTTPYCFIYFHDDIIVPSYIELLLPILEENAKAALVHCDVRIIGAQHALVRASHNDRPLAERLLQFMLAPGRGAPLRGIMRREVMGDVRFPTDAPHGLYANEIFLLAAVSRGAFLAAPEVLYLNWASRPEGLVSSWAKAAAGDVGAGLRSIFADALAILNGAAQNDAQRAMFGCACFLWLSPLITEAEERIGQPLFSEPGELHRSLADADWPPIVGSYPPDIQDWLLARWPNAAADLQRRRGA